MEAKHTQGPWVYEPGDQTSCGSIVAPARFVCDFAEDPTKEDGLLIAAAPDLLNLAYEMEAFSEAAMQDAEEEGDALGVETWRTLMGRCRAAIAEATGSAS